MAAFALTPNGIKPLQESAAPPGGITNAGAFVANLRESAAAIEAQAAAATPPAKKPERAQSERLKRRDYAKELRARLRIVERELANMRQLEAERDDIKRLIGALKALPATVTDITSARKSG